MTRHVHFAAAPNIGTELFLDSQRFEVAAVESAVRANGEPTSLLTWIGACARCGQYFEVLTGLSCKALPRRCEPCRKIAKSPVNGSRKKPVIVRVVNADHHSLNEGN